MNASLKLRLVIMLLVLGSTVGCDQISKHVARTELSGIDFISLLGGFGELRLAENPGAFLSLGDALPQAARRIIFTVGVAIGLLALFIHLLRSNSLDWFTFSGLVLLMAGGASNLVDRATRDGHVTDFITLRLGPLQTGVFNVADVVVMLGVGLILFGQWKLWRRNSSGKAPAE